MRSLVNHRSSCATCRYTPLRPYSASPSNEKIPPTVVKLQLSLAHRRMWTLNHSRVNSPVVSNWQCAFSHSLAVMPF
jgi:hypothetical protein